MTHAQSPNQWKLGELPQAKEGPELLESLDPASSLLQLLERNAGQVRDYLEEAILDNPFIDLDHPAEQTLAAFDQYLQDHEEADSTQVQQSLESYLFEQIMLYRHTPIRDCMVDLVALLDSRGYLPYSTEDLAKETGYDPIVVLDAVTLVKLLEPAGIGAYDLQESLMLQTERDSLAPPMAYYLLEAFFEPLKALDDAAILSQVDISPEDLAACQSYYQTLVSHPAGLFNRHSLEGHLPDFTVSLQGEDLVWRYNRDFYPQLTFNQAYYVEVHDYDEEVQAYCQEKKAAYQLLASQVQDRDQLLTRVVGYLVSRQGAFFQGQVDWPETLTLKEISQALSLPKGVVRRALSNKRLAFKGTLYALTDFINRADTSNREGFSAHYVRDLIQKILAEGPEDLATEAIVHRLKHYKIIISPQIVDLYRKQ